MSTHRVSDLTGPLLDAAVAQAEGFPSFWIDPGDESREAACVLGPARAQDARFDWNPSTDWSQGGPIIERERIELRCHMQSAPWSAMGNGTYAEGPTPLIAAMRAYVASKFGDTVELP